jgi:hypothetical protein
MVAMMATAVAVKIPKNLKVIKNKITGNRSNRNLFMVGSESLSRLEVGLKKSMINNALA